MTAQEQPEEKEGEGKGGEAPRPGASVILPDEVKSQLKPELVKAIEHGAPIVVIVQYGSGTLRAKEVRTFEKGFKIASQKRVDPEELETLRKDFHALLDVHAFMEERVKKADADWRKLFQEHRQLKKEVDKAKRRTRLIKEDIQSLAAKHRI